MQIDDLIRAVEADAPDDEPLTLLRTASSMVESVTDAADAALGYFVDQARRAGHSWTDIGACLGVSKQAAQQKHVRVSSDLQTQLFGRCTDRARRVVGACEEVARDLGHTYIGTEHVLLAQFAEPQAIAARLLKKEGLSAKKVRAAIVELTGEGDGAPDGEIPFTPRARELLRDALGIALVLGHNYIGTEHMLLAMFRGEGIAGRILADAGLDEEAMRDAVVAEIEKVVK